MCYFLLHLLTSSHESGHHDTSSHESGHHDWSYGEGSEGPDHWGGITPGAIASKGIRQSPIDINSSTTVSSSKLGKTTLGPIEFNYSGSILSVMNNGHTIQVDCNSTEGNTIKINGQQYELLQFHFHARSEHRIDGVDYPMELHLVHVLSENPKDESKPKPKQLAVVGVMIKEGPPNQNQIIEEIRKDVWFQWPGSGDEPNGVTARKFSADVFLPPEGERSYFLYHGSLTTPPCSENVLWLVMEKPISLTKEQIKQFAELYESNRRPIQGAFRRIIMRYSDDSDSASATTEPSALPITSASSFIFPVQPGGIK